MIEAAKVFAKATFKPSTAWLALFIPALFYYVGNAFYSYGLFRSSTYGESLIHEVVLIRTSSNSDLRMNDDEVLCSEFMSSINKNSKLLYMENTKKCDRLRYPLYIVHDNFDDDSGGGSIESTSWMEDDELGRGYLLISTSAGLGKLYRWETGGGPIAIGRTLHLNDSGCRSNIYKKCSDHRMGSGGIAVDNYRSDSSRRLIIAEYGEGRIVRLEENGARTPLVIEMATTNKSSTDNNSVNEGRLCRPFQLLMTPYGDLLIVDDATSCGDGFNIWRLRKASSVPSLTSLAISRRAHGWKKNNNTGLPDIFFRSQKVGGMVLDTTGQRIYITTFDFDSSSVLVVSFPLLDDLDAIDDEEESTEGKINSFQSTIVFNYTAHTDTPGPLEIDKNGNLYLAVETGILLVSQPQTPTVVKINFFAGEKIVDLTLGSDRFLYIAMRSKLARVQVPNLPLEIKTELLIKA